MPYKQDVIALIDALDPSAERLSAVNTIVHEDGVLTGYNTDYTAVRQLLRTAEVDPDLPVAVRGSGGMANAVVAALADHGLSGVVVARNHLTGAALASRYEWDYSAQVPQEAQFLVNVTPIGMHGPDPEVSQAQAFSDDELSRARIVLDAVAFPTNTPLVRAARSRDIPVITGAQIAALQAAEQFALYTGVRPSPEQVAAAEEYASAPEAQSAQ